MVTRVLLDPHSGEDPVEGPLKKPSRDSTEQAKSTGEERSMRYQNSGDI